MLNCNLTLFQGHMDTIGSYHQLVNSGVDFASMLSESHEEETIPTVLRSTGGQGTMMNGTIPKVKALQELEHGKNSYKSVGFWSL